MENGWRQHFLAAGPRSPGPRVGGGVGWGGVTDPPAFWEAWAGGKTRLQGNVATYPSLYISIFLYLSAYIFIYIYIYIKIYVYSSIPIITKSIYRHIYICIYLSKYK